MRHGRAKAARRALQFFHRIAGFKPPFHVLLDGPFVVAVVKYKLPLQERLDRLLQHTTLVLCVTDSTIAELKKLAEDAPEAKAVLLKDALDWASSTCRVIKEIPGTSSVNEREQLKLSEVAKDILRLASPASDEQDNDFQQPYFVASQDEDLLHLVRQTGRIPVIRLARGSVLLLEQPSKVANHQAKINEKKKWTVAGSVTEQEKLLVDVAKEQHRGEHGFTRHDHEERRKRKAKGPNPLSCKRKRGAPDEKLGSTKRRRRRKGEGGATTTNAKSSAREKA